MAKDVIIALDFPTKEETLHFLGVKEGEPERLAQLYSGHSYGRSASMGMMASLDVMIKS